MIFGDGVPEGQHRNGQACLQPSDDRSHVLVAQHAGCIVKVGFGPDGSHRLSAGVGKLTDVVRHDDGRYDYSRCRRKDEEDDSNM